MEAYAVGFAGSAIFTATGTQASAGMIVVDTGNDQIGAIGQPLPKPFIAVVVDNGHNRLAGVPVTFVVQQGGGNFDGESSFTVETDSDGRAAATLTLGLQQGNANNLVEANFPSNQGFPAAFTASGRSPGDPAKTSISGVVLDNSNIPIPGVTIRAVLTNVLHSNVGAVQLVPAVQTDTQGQFSIPQAPVGFVKLVVDGSTATLPGTYPSLEYDVVTVAGQTNTIGQPIYLLPLDTTNQLCVTATTGGGTLTIPEAPGFSLTFGPGQVTFPGSSKTGCVSVTIVHGDKVPMVPGFGQQPRFIVTIQPAGAVFRPPAPITLPNVDGLSPRAITELYSFDHDIGSFVAIGTGTVSDDGLIIRSAPGVGVLKAGWHCGGNPTPAGTAAECGPCAYCDGQTCQPNPVQGNSCQNPCLVGGTGVCTDGHCVGTVLVGAPCGNGGTCDASGNCVFGGGGGGGGGCGNCNSGNPCIDDSCDANGQCVATANHLCQDACNGLAAGATCAVGSVIGVCDASGNCNLCGGLSTGTSCTCSGGGLGTCDSTGQCSCQCRLAIEALGPVFTGSLQSPAPTLSASMSPNTVEAAMPAAAFCPLPGVIPTIVVGPGTAQQVRATVCSGGNCPTSLAWQSDDVAIAVLTTGSCSAGQSTVTGNSAIVCPAPGATAGSITRLRLKDSDNVDRATAEIKIGGTVRITLKSKCGSGYTGTIVIWRKRRPRHYPGFQLGYEPVYIPDRWARLLGACGFAYKC